jgi:hypothetical protein
MRGLRPSGLVRAIMSADRGHVHYLLLRSGWSIRSILFTLYALSAGLGALALWARTLSAASRWGLWLGLVVAGTVALYTVERRLTARPSEAEADAAASEQPSERRAAG